MSGRSERHVSQQIEVLQNSMENGEDLLNSLLCDELLAEVLCRVQDCLDQKSISLVCKRWLTVHRNVKTSLGLCIPNDVSNNATISYFCSSINSLLRQHPHLTTLSMISEEASASAELLGIVVKAVALWCKSLREFHFTAGPATLSGLQELAKGCPRLTSLELLRVHTRCLPILGEFKELRELSLKGCLEGDTKDLEGTPYGLLQLERLCLEGISAAKCGLGWLWYSCRQLTKLELFNCEGIGDMDTVSFVHCLPSLQEIQLRRCRSIAEGVLMLVSEHCPGLKALIFHDGGDTEGLRHVIRRCEALEILDLRLPLDLSNEDLVEIAGSCRSLRSLRLHSCWLATGVGMRSLAARIKSNLEELVLVRCRAVVQDPGTLSALGQHLRSLKNLDLSENDHLADKELVAMLASCENLLQLKLSRCRKLTDRAVECISRRCPMLHSIDIRSCDGISTKAISTLLSGCSNLRRVAVEMSKLTDTTKNLAFIKGISFVGAGCSTEGRINLVSQNMYLELGSMS